MEREMKKIILLALAILMMVGCGNPTPNKTKVNKKVNETPAPNKYEVLLSTKDTIYVEAYYYTSHAGFWGNGPIETISFYDRKHYLLQEINNPVYIKEIRTK